MLDTTAPRFQGGVAPALWCHSARLRVGVGVWLTASRSWVWALGARKTGKVVLVFIASIGGNGSVSWGVHWGVFPKPQKDIQNTGCPKTD